MKVTVMFRDVLDLVPQSTVKVDDVTVGKVTRSTLKGYVAEVTVELPGDVELPGQRPGADPPDQPPRREVRLSSSGRANPGSGKLVERRRHRPRPHRPQPRGRRGLRCARAAAQRRWRRPAQDDRLRAEQRLRRPRGRGPLGADPDPHLHGPAGPEQGRRSSPRSRTPTGWPWRSASRTAPSRARWTTSPTRCASVNRQRDDLVKLLKALTRLSGVGVRVIQASKESTINSLRDLAPVLEGFAKAGRELPEVLPGLPDLPVRRRGRRPRPAGGPQPAHG